MTRKINSFEECLGQVRTFGTGTMYSLDILRQCDKRLKTKIQTVLELIPTFAEVTGGKLVGGGTMPTYSMAMFRF